MPGVYLIPSILSEDGIDAIHPYSLNAIRACQVIFTENQRTTRRFLKQAWKKFLPADQIEIDQFEWFDMDDRVESIAAFKKSLKENKTVGIFSEAGCPGIADPGQKLVATAQEMNISVHPLTGPNSILLALMASGMNGQQFRFAGYLPVDSTSRAKAIKELETESQRKKCTGIFIETPYRNNQMIETLLKTCQGTTRLCIAANITGSNEFIRTKTILEWKKTIPDLHKQPVIFLIYAAS